MSPWRDAVAAANTILERFAGRDVRGVRIVLTDYDGGLCYRALKPESPWSLEHHRNVNQAVARALRARGAKVRYEKISLMEFTPWLENNNLENTSENRAAFASLTTK
jgi:hypothetical protein